MNALEIPVTYNGSDLCFKAHVARFGYVNHVVVDLFGNPVTIERDEEGNYRALGDEEKLKNSKVDVELVQAVITVLQSLWISQLFRNVRGNLGAKIWEL